MRKWWHLAAVAAGAIACRGAGAYADLHRALSNTAHASFLQQVALNDTCIPWRPDLAENIYALRAALPTSEEAGASVKGGSQEPSGFYIDELGFCNDPTCPCHDSVIESLDASSDSRRPVIEADNFQQALEQTTAGEQGYTADNPEDIRSESSSDSRIAQEDGQDTAELGEDNLYGYKEDHAGLSVDDMTGNEYAEELNRTSDGLFDDPFGWEYGAEDSSDDIAGTVTDTRDSETWIHQNLINDPYPALEAPADEDASAARGQMAAEADEPMWIDYGEFDFQQEFGADQDEFGDYEEEWAREMEDQAGLRLYGAEMTDEELRAAYGEEPLPESSVDAFGDAELVDEYFGSERYDEEELFEDWRYDELTAGDEMYDAGDGANEAIEEVEPVDTGFEPYSYDDFYSPEAYGEDEYAFDGEMEAEPTPVSGSESAEAQYYDDVEYYDIEYYDANYDSYDSYDSYDRYVDPMTYDSPEQLRLYENTPSEDSSDLHMFYPGEDWSEYMDDVESSDSAWRNLFDAGRLVEIIFTMPYAGRVGAMVEQAVRLVESSSAWDAAAAFNAHLSNITEAAPEDNGSDELEELIGDGGELMCPYCQLIGWEYDALTK